jgi:uroporphyrinogen decarboxylase
MRHEEPDMVPLFEFGMEIPIIEAILGKRLPRFAESSFHNPRCKPEELVMAYETLGLDMVTIGDDAFFSESATPVWKDARTYVNEFGQVWRVEESKNTELYYGGNLQLSDGMLLPELDPFQPSRTEYARQVVKAAKGREMAVAANVHGGFSSAYLGCGMERFFAGMILHPKEVSALISAFTYFWTELTKQLIDLGVDVIGVGDDLADKHGPFLSPADWRRFVKPALERIARDVEREGGLAFFHSDGNINLVLDDIVEIGFDGLHSMEPLAGMDIGSIKKRYGDKLCLLGNVDCSHTLCFSSLSEVAEETRKVIKQASPGGGHILCSSNSLHSAVRLENFLTMVATGRRLGRYPLFDIP